MYSEPLKPFWYYHRSKQSFLTMDENPVCKFMCNYIVLSYLCAAFRYNLYIQGFVFHLYSCTFCAPVLNLVPNLIGLFL